MMTLGQAAKVFNKTLFTDLLGANHFYGQMLPFADNTRSGSTSRRRILEVAPATTVPETIIDTTDLTKYITAFRSSDSYRGSTIRDKYPIVPADGTYTLNTIKGLLSETTGTVTIGAVNYNRREPVTDSSTNLGGFLAVLPISVPATAGEVLYHNGVYYRVMESSYLDPIGLLVFEVVRVQDAVQTLSVTTGRTYDPISETYTGGSTTSGLCLVEDREKSFDLLRQDSSKDLAGDMSIFTLQACEVGDIIGEYQIISKRTEDTVNFLHCRAL